MKVVNISDKKAISVAIKVIKNGGVIICPTDTVYGFLADASNKKAVDKIFKLKKRLRSKPLPVFVRDLKMAKDLAEISKDQEKILTLRLRSGRAKYWPGKYTAILKRKHGINLYGVKKDTIALRIPKYKFLNNLLEKLNKPVVQTSVNISGNPSLTKIKDMKTILNKSIGTYDVPILIIDGGNLPKRKSSIIIDLIAEQLIRLR